MTRDPLFAKLDRLPPVDNEWSATRFERCDGPDRVVLEDGSQMWFTEDDQAPTFDAMPFARVVEAFFVGAPMVLRDHGEAIDAELATWNAAHAGPDITPDDELPAAGQGEDEDGFCSCTSTTHLRGSGTMTLLLLLGLASRRRWPALADRRGA